MSIFKKKLFKWVVLPVLVIGITGSIVAYKMYNKPHRSVADASAIAITADEIVSLYETDENKANGLYLDKVLNISGEVTAVAKNQKDETVITLKGSDMGGVICTLEGKETATVQKGSAVKLQGICTGYLTDVVLVRCYLSNN
jgi:tRNA_anti-like